MPTYKLIIEYDGSRYSGWQDQPNARTVQGTIVHAVRGMAGECELGGAGRTDAGVHALGQVAHLTLRNTVQHAKFVIRLNSALPKDIHIKSMAPSPPRFHARHDAVERFYLYQIALRRSAFHKNYIWWVREPLDLERMKARLKELNGMRDFTAFADKRREETDSGKVLITACTLVRDGDLLLFRIGGSHFLWRMVRRIVGVLVAVGTGKLPNLTIDELIRTHSRKFPELTAPASGLFLELVRYKDDPPPGSVAAVTPLR